MRLAHTPAAVAPIRLAGTAAANAVMFAATFLMLREVQQFIYFQF